jgi:choline dehydrogenase-like flavoprotein
LLIDARTLPDGETLTATVCVVGAGPAGIAIARSLAAAGIEVLLIEAGGFKPEPEIEALSDGEVAPGSPHAPLHLYRRRVIGGASYVWGGRCTPLDPIDFETRSWIPHSGWPFDRAELQPWYEQANPFVDAGRFDYTVAGSLAGRGAFIDGFSSPALHTDRLERFSKPTNIGRLYRDELAASAEVRLVHHAVCTGIRLHHAAERTEMLELRALTGTRLVAKAEAFVLAQGTLETVRLMLASNDVMRDGVGNHSGWLGRSYLTHIEGTLGELHFTPADRPVIWGYEKSDDGIYVRRRFAVSEAAQAKHRVANGIVRLNHPSVVDPAHGQGILSAAYFVKNLLVPEYSRRIAWTDRRTAERLAAMGRTRLFARHALNMLKDLPKVASFGPWWLWVRNLQSRQMPSLVLPSRSGSYPLDFNVEQAPNPESRISLATSRDRFDVPRLRVDWRMSEVDRHTIRATLALFRDAVVETGCATFTFDPETALDQFTAIGGHQMGGARMAADPALGVVDSQCRVHGVANLYLAGNQIFPTVGYANPTLTTVALALRLAGHLADRLRP